ncbi:putative aminomethyl transferase [Tricharina praecox]|uniref:putative aminomethyl transferase n=1 Tax=Tricharina praecox TaxID=43433 RepID=UPI002220AAB7|nr:putative aminomethyl transferase [Tricharina praecox]KAI5854559.1 putative aminomethyl transferase [Tricharina praecox]
MILRHFLRRSFNSSSTSPTITNLSATRSLLHLHGPDAAKFLQGITTSQLLTPPPTGAVYSGLLTAQGRVLFDTFIYPANTSAAWRASLSQNEDPQDPAFFIEADAAEVLKLKAHLRRYKLRSKVAIREVEDWGAWSVWDGSAAAGDLGGVDPRAPGFGARVVLPAGARPQGEEVGATEYMLRRIMYGVAEGAREIVPGTALPLESNMDLAHGVDFRKGCYVGQELTIRTKHTGIVRKRILPVALYAASEAPPTTLEYTGGAPQPEVGADIRNIGGRRGRPVGKWLDGLGNVGFALCRLEPMAGVVLEDGVKIEGEHAESEEVGEFRVGEEGESEIRVKAFVPAWMGLQTR